MKGNARLKSRQDVARILNVDPQTVSNWCQKGVLKEHHVGKIVMIDMQTVETLLDSLKDLKECEQQTQQLLETAREQEEELRRKINDCKEAIGFLQGISLNYHVKNIITSLANTLGNALAQRDKEILIMTLEGANIEQISDNYQIGRARIAQVISHSLKKIGKLADYEKIMKENQQLKKDVAILMTNNQRLRQQLKEKTKEDEKLEKEEVITEEEIDIAKKLTIRLADCNLSVRSFNCLLSWGVTTIGELVEYNMDDILTFRGVGVHSFEEIKQLVEGMGLTFGMKTEKILERYETYIHSKIEHYEKESID